MKTKLITSIASLLIITLALKINLTWEKQWNTDSGQERKVYSLFSLSYPLKPTDTIISTWTESTAHSENWVSVADRADLPPSYAYFSSSDTLDNLKFVSELIETYFDYDSNSPDYQKVKTYLASVILNDIRSEIDINTIEAKVDNFLKSTIKLGNQHMKKPYPGTPTTAEEILALWPSERALP